MIEIRGLSKVYQTTTKSNVEAIKNVSIQFPQNGMVFLLGKSGSGKSTLLNILGGLDKPTAGELLIDNISSRTFTSLDYDIYRNTFVGFIFQEFNIIEELNVKDNIGLALQLQNIDFNDSDIHKALRKVDLEGMEERKSNELSGGQRQRVAIARALVKNPKLILADEPTGALDSQTSTKIFDLLKSLSKDRLIVIASHDHEAAKRYADRIIELKDGNVIADNEKNSIEISSLNSSKLLKKPRLPLKFALRIALSNFRKKKLKFLLSLLLTSISFSMFGILASIMTFDENETLTEALQKADYDAISVEKSINNFKSTKICFDSYGEQMYEFEQSSKSNSQTLFTENDIKVLNNDGLNFVGIINPTMDQKIKCRQYKVTYPLDVFYDSTDLNCFGGFCDCGSDCFNNLFSFVKGDYPATSEEIAISEYKANGFINSVDNDGNKIFESIDDLLGSKIDLFYGQNDANLNLKICGIYKTKKIPEKFEELKTFPGFKNDSLLTEWKNYKKSSFLDIGFVSDSFYKDKISYFDYDIDYIGDAKLENNVNLYSCIDDKSCYFKGRELEYKIEKVIPFSLFKEHQKEFEISYIGEPTENIDLKDDEILITEDFRDLIQKNKYVALLNDLKTFYYKGAKFSNPFKVYIPAMNDFFASSDFMDTIESYSDNISLYPETDVNQLDEQFLYLNNIVDLYYAEASKREFLYTTLLSYGYDSNCSMFNSYLKNVYENTLTNSEIESLKEWSNKCALFDFDSSSNFIFSEEEWKNIELFFEKNYEKTIGLYRGVMQFELLMPYSLAVNQVEISFDESDSIDIEEMLGYIKNVNDSYASFSELLEALSNGMISNNNIANIRNTMIMWNDGLSTISYYKYGVFAERFPYEKSFDLTDLSRNSRIKTIGFCSFKNLNLKHMIVANSNTLKKFNMMISQNNENIINSYDYDFTNEGKYSFILGHVAINKDIVKKMNSSYGKYSLKTSDYTSTLIKKALSMSDSIKWIALIVGISFGVFSSLLLFSFVTDSIRNKEKEIGILRSLGASAKDVFKTFFVESIVISILSIVFANIIGGILIFVINSSLASNFMNISLFKYNFLVIFIIITISLTVSVLSSLIPIIKICKKNTIDAIRQS